MSGASRDEAGEFRFSAAIVATGGPRCGEKQANAREIVKFLRDHLPRARTSIVVQMTQK
jgi:hypothetical protein